LIKTRSEKEADRLRREKELEELNEKRRKFFNVVAATEEGKDVFSYLAEILGFHRPSVMMNPQTGEVNKETTVYWEARRSVYLDIRKYISDSNLKTIEFK